MYVRESNKIPLSERLSKVCPEVIISPGKSITHREGDLEFSVLAQSVEGNEVYLVTVFAGFPAPESVQGISWTLRDPETESIVRVGQTDHRGQFWLKNLPAKPFSLSLEHSVLKFAGPAAVARVDSRLTAAAAASTGVCQSFREGSWNANLRTVNDQNHSLIFDAEVDLKSGKLVNQLFRVRFFDETQALHFQMFLGLDTEFIPGRGIGEINLTRIHSNLRHRLQNSKIEIVPVRFESLAWNDLEDLKSSLLGIENLKQRQVLEQAVNSLEIQHDLNPDD